MSRRIRTTIAIVAGFWLVFLVTFTGCQVAATQPIKLTEYKTVTITQPVELADFKTIEELENWLAAQELPRLQHWNCIDYALALQQCAFADGYIMNFVMHENEYYNSFFTRFQLAEGTHAFNSVRIGDYIYYIEPQNFEISRRAANLQWHRE